MRNKKIKFTLTTISVGFAVALAVGIVVSLNHLDDNPMYVEDRIPADYSNIFTPNAQKGLLLQYASVSFKARSAIVSLTYKHMYDIELTKIITQPNFDLTSDIVVTDGAAKGVFPEIMLPYNSGDFDIHFSGEKENTASKILLTLHGDTIHTYPTNDNFAYYYSNLKYGFLQYKAGGIYEISIKAKKKFLFFEPEKPIIIMFLRKNGSLYFITLRAINKNEVLKPDTLYNLVQI